MVRPRFTARRWLKLGSAHSATGGGCGCSSARAAAAAAARGGFVLQSGPAWSRTAPIPFTEFARETRRLAWRERARNVASQGRCRARNIAAPPLRRRSARARPAPPTPCSPAPTRTAGRERGAAHCASNWGRANGGGGGNRLQLNRPAATSIGFPSSLVAILVLLFAFQPGGCFCPNPFSPHLGIFSSNPPRFLLF